MSSASPAASGGASASSTTDACTLVTKADAERVVGSITETPSATSGTIPGTSMNGSACVYRGAGGVLTIGLSTTSTSKTDFDSAAKQVPGAQPIAGLGDSAYGSSAGQGSASGATILVLKGSTFFSLTAGSTSATGDPLLNSLKSLAETAVTRR